MLPQQLSDFHKYPILYAFYYNFNKTSIKTHAFTTRYINKYGLNPCVYTIYFNKSGINSTLYQIS